MATQLNLPLLVLGFGILILALELVLLYKSQAVASDKSIALVGVTLVVVSVLFLASSPFSESHTAAAIGLLGTVLGYVAGKKQDSSRND